MNWFEMPGALEGVENNPEFLMKADEQDEKTTINLKKTYEFKHRTCAWVRKRYYKKKIIRRFLSMNPAMDFSKKNGVIHEIHGIYLNFACYDERNGEFNDPHVNYCINPYTRVYLSNRGNLRIMHGDLFRIRTSFAIGNTKKDAIKCMNRRLRRADFSEYIPSYRFCKRYYCPRNDEIW